MFVGPIARLLGFIINGIYMFMDRFLHIENIGLCIIIFTIIVYTCLLPLTIRQQKFSKLSMKMQPELNAIQKKYEGKRDEKSMAAMQEETQMLYQKYGISPTGSCVQMIIQMPILLAMYRCIYNVPAYVNSVKELFTPVVDGITATSGYQDILTNFMEAINLRTVAMNFTGTAEEAYNSVIDMLYRMPTSAWETLKATFSSLSGAIQTLESQLSHINYFLGINIADSPMDIIKASWPLKQYGMLVGAALVPIMSVVTQILSIKFMQYSTDKQQKENKEKKTEKKDDISADAMATSMKMMNTIMPIFSGIMTFTVPVGLGIYWITGPIIRTVQQVIINKHVDKIDLDDLIKKNEEKAKKKRAKKGISENQIYNMAHMNTRKLSDKATVNVSKDVDAKSEKVFSETHHYKEGSLSAKANLVKEYNEKNNK